MRQGSIQDRQNKSQGICDSIGPPGTTRLRNDTEVTDNRVTGQKTNEREWRTIGIDSEFGKRWDR